MALPPPSPSCCQELGLDLGLGDVEGLWGAVDDIPRGSRSVRLLAGGQLRAVPHGVKLFVAEWEVVWPGQRCGAWGHFRPRAPCELQPQKQQAAQVGFKVDLGHWNVIIGMAVGECTGCSSSLGVGDDGASAALCTLPKVAAGRSATLAMQEKEISRSRMTPRSQAATSLSPPSLSPSMGHPAPVPPYRAAAGGQGAGTGRTAVPALGS